MFSKLITIDLQKKDELVHLEPFGDLHVGHVGFREDEFIKRRNAVIKDEERYTIFMGDNIDAIDPLDKRWQETSISITDIDNQRAKWQKLIDPLVKRHIDRIEDNKCEKIFGGIAGNHEYKKITQAYITNQFYDPNLIDYLGSRCYIGLDIRYKNQSLRRWSILAIHGAGGGSNPLTALDQMMFKHDADVYLMGHLHDKAIKTFQRAKFKFDDINRWVLQDTVQANTGTFCDTYTDGVDGYMDRKNKVNLSKPGTITITFDAENNKLHAHE